MHVVATHIANFNTVAWGEISLICHFAFVLYFKINTTSRIAIKPNELTLRDSYSHHS